VGDSHKKGKGCLSPILKRTPKMLFYPYGVPILKYYTLSPLELLRLNTITGTLYQNQYFNP